MAGDEIMASDIPNLVFSPVTDEVGLPYTSFDFAVKDSSLYSQSSTMTIDVDAPVNTFDLEVFKKMKIAPNPVQDWLKMELILSRPEANVNFSIINATGQVMYQEELGDLPEGQSVKQVAVNELTDGFYFIKIETSSELITRRFMKL